MTNGRRPYKPEHKNENLVNTLVEEEYMLCSANCM